MRVTKEQLVKGIAQYAENEVIPQIIASIAVKAVKTNSKLVDTILENNTVKALFKYNEDGTYEIEEFFSMVTESIKEYGPFPVVIPPIPLISPTEKTLSFTEADINEMKRRIERSVE